MDKFANATAGRLREEYRREQLEAERSNMTKGGTPVLLNPATGRWLVKTTEMRPGEEPT
jgi:hypothetical protein